MKKDRIPTKDGEFDDYQSNFVTQLTKNATALGVPAAELAGLNTLQSAWVSAFAGEKTARDAHKGAVATKAAARKSYEAVLRPLLTRLGTLPALTPAIRASLRMPDAVKTRTPSAAPQSRPVLSVDLSLKNAHLIHYRDEASPKSKAKPAGVMSCEVRMAVGTATPTDPETMPAHGVITNTPSIEQFAPSQAGQRVFYAARWISRSGQAGPWSDIASATVPG